MTRRDGQWLEVNPRAQEIAHLLGVISDHAFADELATRGVVATNDQVSSWRRMRGVAAGNHRRDIKVAHTEADVRRWIGDYQCIGNLRKVARKYRVSEHTMRAVFSARGVR